MNSRECYLETLLFGSPDTIPFDPGRPHERTLKTWHRERLPKNRDWLEFPCENIRFQPDVLTENPFGD